MGSPLYNPDVGAKNSHSIESLNNVIFEPLFKGPLPNELVGCDQPVSHIHCI